MLAEVVVRRPWAAVLGSSACADPKDPDEQPAGAAGELVAVVEVVVVLDGIVVVAAVGAPWLCLDLGWPMSLVAPDYRIARTPSCDYD